MIGSRWWLVCYDVRDEKRLRRCARHLEGYGERLQDSVFRVWLTRRGLEKLRWELTELLQPEDDVLFIPLCSDCVSGICGIGVAGAGVDWPAEPQRYLII